MTHNHATNDGKAYYDERGRLVKWTYADGCKRMTLAPIPEEYRRAFPDPPPFDGPFAQFEAISLNGERSREGIPWATAFETVAASE